MTQTITQGAALALAYFKEGFPYHENNHVLFEQVSHGGDVEFFTWVLEQIIPVTESYLEQYSLDEPDKLYLFYGNAYPEQLSRLLGSTPTPTQHDLEQCIALTLNVLAQTMRDIRL
ncbi:hypothetical protein [Vibrio scophthalmi]|uniref:Uncharacterized protein n=1 Tax=Vibrio scophthalmi TaxID=45658 RepID=A0A1C7FHP8_9VIBR|nr:hypothetical protein [Vibrio scophthalmi]ANU39490.1 hypothetical protein VSVS05_04455 [Vibrio scophthalmi]